MTPPVTLIVADPDEAAREDLRAALEDHGRFHVSVDVPDAAAALSAATRFRPDLCVLDARLPGDAIRTVAELAATAPRTRAVVLAASPDADEGLRALRAGAAGYLAKDVDCERLAHTLLEVADGETAVPRELVGRVLEEYRGRIRPATSRVSRDGREPDAPDDLPPARPPEQPTDTPIRREALALVRTPEPARVVVGAAQQLLRFGIRQELERAGLSVVGEAGTANGVVRAAIRTQPDVALVEVDLPGGGLDAARRIAARVPRTKLVMLAETGRDDAFGAALAAGASGFVEKDIDPKRLPKVVVAVLAGEPAVPRRLVRRLLADIGVGAATPAGTR